MIGEPVIAFGGEHLSEGIDGDIDDFPELLPSVVGESVGQGGQQYEVIGDIYVAVVDDVGDFIDGGLNAAHPDERVDERLIDFLTELILGGNIIEVVQLSEEIADGIVILRGAPLNEVIEQDASEGSGIAQELSGLNAQEILKQCIDGLCHGACGGGEFLHRIELVIIGAVVIGGDGARYGTAHCCQLWLHVVYEGLQIEGSGFGVCIEGDVL